MGGMGDQGIMKSKLIYSSFLTWLTYKYLEKYKFQKHTK
jgi:hypothetical protein